ARLVGSPSAARPSALVMTDRKCTLTQRYFKGMEPFSNGDRFRTGTVCVDFGDHREHHLAMARALDESANAKQYTPTMSKELVEQIRSWHERGYTQGRCEGAAEQTFDYLGISLVVPPEVMP